jgi:flagellar biosynthesis protein FlhF
MGISDTLAEEVVAYAPESANERQAWLFLLKLLANRLQTKQDDILSKPGVVALMGPTGTGKTTTVAKLAAQAAQKYGSDQVAVVTIDNYRIGAFEQIATYGKIIGCSVKKAQDANELSDLL